MRKLHQSIKMTKNLTTSGGKKKIQSPPIDFIYWLTENTFRIIIFLKFFILLLIISYQPTDLFI